MVLAGETSINKEVVIPDYLPNGVGIGYKLFNDEVSKKENAKFLIYYDPDIDGLMAGYLVQKFFDRFNIVACDKLNENRQHGFFFTDAEWEKYKGYTIFAVDFAIPDAIIQRIVDNGMNLINIDHHEIQGDFRFITSSITGCKAVVINNQYYFEPDDFRFLSGAGMVYYFFDNIAKQFKFELDYDMAAMVGISLFSDIRPTETPKAHAFINVTFNLVSPYMRYLVWVVSNNEDYSRFDSFGLPRMHRNFIDFTFSPRINALLRANKGEEAKALIKCEDWAIQSLKLSGNLPTFRNIQNSLMLAIMQSMDGVDYSHLKVRAVTHASNPYPAYNIANYIGVACSKLKDARKTAFIYLVDETTNVIIRGSVRGSSDTVDYLEIFRSCGIRAEGHKNAFGVLQTDVSKIDFELLNKKIAEAEEVEVGKSTRIIMEVPNLALALLGPNKRFALINSLVRDTHRIYFKYTGTNAVANKRGKMTEFKIDGVAVNCFDLDTDTENGLILAMYGKGDFVEYTLRKDIA